MGLFSRKQSDAPKGGCSMCGAADPAGCEHVVEIRGDNPPWLPANWRAQAQGQFTFLCTRCNSYPAVKWPSYNGADAGMLVHLGSAHHVGLMAGTPRPFEMISAS